MQFVIRMAMLLAVFAPCRDVFAQETLPLITVNQLKDALTDVKNTEPGGAVGGSPTSHPPA